ncbi:hypothetical protein [Nostoc sp. PA-18-2419]|uniref:hypothetical protein n=1 Tax=Nostoc sp. PA-18-2419 TaxID=2575443 RepID=UPI001108F367|nr:hypothetical protein [Nostoc sp. PA-18-2419]
MERKNSNMRLEINNLIDDAVNNAVARRNLGEDSEDTLLNLSDEETAKVEGGIASVSLVKIPIICGLIALPRVLPQINQTSVY